MKSTLSGAGRTLGIASILLVALSLPAWGQSQECGSDMREVPAGDATLHYFECGAGEPVILIHGSLGDLHDFGPQLEPLASEFRVISYSRRHHPPNDPPKPVDQYELNAHTSDLASLVRELEVGPAHLIGHSYGGYVALGFALEYPDLVRSLILAEPPVLPLLPMTSVGGATLESFQRRVFGPTRAAFEKGETTEALRHFVDGICGTGCFDDLPEGYRRDLIENKAAEFRLEVMSDPSRYMPMLGCEALARVEQPTLLVTGENSPSFFPMITAELERCLESESQVMIPRAGHMMNLENREAFNREILEFLRER